MNLSNEIETQLQKKGISEEEIDIQIRNFKEGFPELTLLRAATIGDGILRFTPQETDVLAELYNQQKEHYEVVKFIPASGAASRMFQDLYKFLDTGEETKEIIQFFANIKSFAFYTELKKAVLKHDIQLNQNLSVIDKKKVIELFLTEEGMNYGNLPKALLQFHAYEGHKGVEILTPIEEHIVEGIYYAENQNEVKLHFTVSPEHIANFKTLLDKKMGFYELKNNVKISIQLSVQDESTDQVVVDLANKPLQLSNGELLFNPGGHGALLNNLNRLEEDIIFIKNIDNIQKGKFSTVRNKKLLAGKLIEIQQEIKTILTNLESMKSLDAVYEFFQRSLQFDASSFVEKMSLENQKEFIYDYLNRPIRVVGMVINEGEPGGGPFWYKEQNGIASLQIMEKAQINIKDVEQKAILDSSTHFNPVDLVCFIKDYKGQKFDLYKFRNDRMGFISQKNKFGKEVLIQELPGLWNGAMGHWITIFVEVPLDTFSPVKMVLDLLRPAHQ